MTQNNIKCALFSMLGAGVLFVCGCAQRQYRQDVPQYDTVNVVENLVTKCKKISS